MILFFNLRGQRQSRYCIEKNIISSEMLMFVPGVNVNNISRCDGTDRKKKNQFYNISEHKNGGAGLGIFFLENASLHLE